MKYLGKPGQNAQMILEINNLLAILVDAPFDNLGYKVKKDNEIHIFSLITDEFLVGITYAKLSNAYKIWMYDMDSSIRMENIRKANALPLNNKRNTNVPGKGYYVGTEWQCAEEIKAIYKEFSV